MPITNLAPLLERNVRFAQSEADARRSVPAIPFLPRRNAFVLTCVDPRTHPSAFLGIGLGDAIVLRNVGGRVTPAVIQDIAYISYLVETKTPDRPHFELAVIHHTDCGSGLLADGELRHGFAEYGGYDEETLAALAVLDPEHTVRADVGKLLADPRLSPRITVSGHVYDVSTGLVHTVIEPATTVRPR